MTFPSHNLDLHRLHECIRKLERGSSPFYRGEGQTTARLYLMLGEVEQGDAGNQYLFVAENSIGKQMAVRDFVELIADVHPDLYMEMMKAKDDWYPDTIVMPNGQVYRFVTADTLTHSHHFVYGSQYARVFFDVSYYKQDQLDTNGYLTEALSILQELGAEFV